jgi:hypothetical protein
VKFLVKGYKDECFYWEILVMFQKLVIVTISVFFSASLQIYFGLWVLFVYIMITVRFKPFTEIIVFKRMISNDERLDVEKYLAKKYAIKIT